MSAEAWSGVIQPWQLAGECGAVEIEGWDLLHYDDTFTVNVRLIEVVLHESQIVGNLGAGVSVRSFLEAPDGVSEVVTSANRQYVNAIAATIAVERCSVCGNGKEPGVPTSAPVGDGGGGLESGEARQALQFLQAA
jgi:hypothetical protein